MLNLPAFQPVSGMLLPGITEHCRVQANAEFVRPAFADFRNGFRFAVYSAEELIRPVFSGFLQCLEGAKTPSATSTTSTE